MKNLLTILLISISSTIVAQKTITYEEMKTITKGAFENITCDIYVAKDGHQYKVGCHQEFLALWRFPQLQKKALLNRWHLRKAAT